MAVAGFCRGCGQYVWLNDQWGCVNGHSWTEIGNWYDPQTGTPVTPYWLQPGPTPQAAPAATPAPTPAAEAEPVAAIPAPEPTPAAEPPATSDRLTALADILATLGQYPAYRAVYGTDTDIVVESAPMPGFSAIMKAVEPESTLYYWEQLAETGGAWDYGTTRRIIEDVAVKHGWSVKLVLRRNEAAW